MKKNKIYKKYKIFNKKEILILLGKLKKPDNLQQVVLSIFLTAIKIINLCKTRWSTLTQKALNLKLGKKRYLYVFCIGLFNCVATTPISFILILPLTFGTLLYIIDKQQNLPLKTQLYTIFFFLFGHFVSIFWWFIVPLFTDISHLFIVLPLALFGLPFIISLCFIPFFTIFLFIWKKCFIEQTLFKRLSKSKNSQMLADVFLFIFFLIAWFCGDWFRGHIPFGGFPWMLFGHFVPYAFAIQPVKIMGIDIYSLFFLSLVLVPYCLIFKKTNKPLKHISITIIILWCLNCIIGIFILVITPTTKFKQNILTTQINHPASLDSSANAKTILQQNLGLVYWNSKSLKETIVIMPEGTINLDLQSGSNLAKILGQMVPNDQSLLIAGGIYWDYNGLSPYNVSYAIDSNGYIVDLYKKQKLVPFGEYIPFRKYIPTLVRTITGGMVDFIKTGDNSKFIFHKNLPIIYPTICYESIFPDYVKDNIIKSREKFYELDKEYLDISKIKSIAERGEVIVNLTNDAWIKWSFAPYQHFLMARFLAVATGLPVIRVSNNGISAIIDKTGVVIKKTKLNTKDILFLKADN